MNVHRSIERRQLDQRLAGLAARVGVPPVNGWFRTIRTALGMSTYDVAERLGISQSRARGLERAEVAGSIRLSTLGRAAEAVSCELVYAFVPIESLEQLVQRQARLKAVEQLGSSVDTCAIEDEHRDLLTGAIAKQVEALALKLSDQRGLWRRGTPAPSPLAPWSPE